MNNFNSKRLAIFVGLMAIIVLQALYYFSTEDTAKQATSDNESNKFIEETEANSHNPSGNNSLTALASAAQQAQKQPITTLGKSAGKPVRQDGDLP